LINRTVLDAEKSFYLWDFVADGLLLVVLTRVVIEQGGGVDGGGGHGGGHVVRLLRHGQVHGMLESNL
jgi:hypothetical protein